MSDRADPSRGRARRVRKNLRQGLALAWAASPQALVRYSLLGMISAAMPPIAVYLGAMLVNRIASARLQALGWQDVLPIIIGLWAATGVQRAIGAYMGYGRNLFVRRVQLEAERRLLEQASKVDLGHFDNSDWHDRLARAKRDVSWRPGDLTWSVLGLRQYRHHRVDGGPARQPALVPAGAMAAILRRARSAASPRGSRCLFCRRPRGVSAKAWRSACAAAPRRIRAYVLGLSVGRIAIRGSVRQRSFARRARASDATGLTAPHSPWYCSWPRCVTAPSRWRGAGDGAFTLVSGSSALQHLCAHQHTTPRTTFHSCGRPSSGPGTASRRENPRPEIDSVTFTYPGTEPRWRISAAHSRWR